MQVILLEHIQGVGAMGDEVAVARGYARNFLLPRQKAVLANTENRARFEAERAEREANSAASKQAATEQAETLQDVAVSIMRAASETGVLYGSVKSRDIESALDEQGHTVPRRLIQIGQPMKELGTHTVQLFLHPEVIVPLQVHVVRLST